METPLRNSAWERFAVLVASGIKQATAYKTVYTDSSANAARSSACTLRAKPNVSARIESLKEDTLEHFNAYTRDRLHSWLATVVEKGTMGTVEVPPRDRLKAASLLASIGGYHAPARSEKLSLHASIDATAQHTDFAKRLAAAKQIKGGGGQEQVGVVVTPLTRNMDSEIPSDLDGGKADKLGPSLDSVPDSVDAIEDDSLGESPSAP